MSDKERNAKNRGQKEKMLSAKPPGESPVIPFRKPRSLIARAQGWASRDSSSGLSRLRRISKKYQNPTSRLSTT